MRSIKLGIPVLLVSALALPGQENGELESWMKATGASSASLGNSKRKPVPKPSRKPKKSAGSTKT